MHTQQLGRSSPGVTQLDVLSNLLDTQPIKLMAQEKTLPYTFAALPSSKADGVA